MLNVEMYGAMTDPVRLRLLRTRPRPLAHAKIISSSLFEEVASVCSVVVIYCRGNVAEADARNGCSYVGLEARVRRIIRCARSGPQERGAWSDGFAALCSWPPPDCAGEAASAMLLQVLFDPLRQ